MGMAAVPLMIGGGLMSAASQLSSGMYNKRASDLMANDALHRSDVAGSLALARGGRAAAGARSAAAGSGVDVQSGSITDVAGGSRLMSALDAAMIRSNAMREAYGLRSQGELAMRQGESGMVGTLLTTAGSAGMTAYKAGAFNPSTAAAETKPESYFQAYDQDNFPDLVRG